VGGACGTHGRVENSVQGLGGKARRKEITRKTESQIGGWIRMDLMVIDWRGVEWIDLAQNRNRWRVLVNTVMRLWVLEPRKLCSLSGTDYVLSYWRIYSGQALASKS
jgi:hypothetical protein